MTVESLVPAGPADRAGIRVGDAVIGINGIDVRLVGIRVGDALIGINRVDVS